MEDDRRASPDQRTTGLWCTVAGILIAVCCWPLVAGMVVVNDDLKFLRSTACELPVADHMRQMWASQSFRPLEILAGRMCDTVTLRCTGVVLIQMTGFVAIWLALCALSRRPYGSRLQCLLGKRVRSRVPCRPVLRQLVAPPAGIIRLPTRQSPALSQQAEKHRGFA